MRWLPLVLVLMVPVGIFCVDRLLLWMERRGWIYYRITRPDPRNLGPAFLEVQSLFESEKKYILEEQVSQKEQDDDEGGPDKAGRSKR